jgi:hypothetical protein
MRCPVCRAQNGDDDACRRCKADLSLLTALEASRRAALQSAAHSAAAGDGARALEFTSVAHRLRAGSDTHRSFALAYLLLRDFSRAKMHHDLAVTDANGQ